METLSAQLRPFLQTSDCHRWISHRRGQWCGALGFSFVLASMSCWMCCWSSETPWCSCDVTPPSHKVCKRFCCVIITLQWRHNERDGISNHQPHDCLLKRLFRRRSKKTSKLRVTGFCEGNSPLTGEFPAQRGRNAKNVSIWWRHHDNILMGSREPCTIEWLPRCQWINSGAPFSYFNPSRDK